MKTDKLEKVVCTLMCDAYQSEKSTVDILTEMADAATHAEITKTIRTHMAETEIQVERLENAFKHFDMDRKDVSSPITDALISEGNVLYKGCEEGPVRDAAIMVALQRIKHQEIVTYGSIIAIAKAANMQEIVSILKPSLDEEYNADKALTKIAEGFANVTALYEQAA